MPLNFQSLNKYKKWRKPYFDEIKNEQLFATKYAALNFEAILKRPIAIC